MPSCVLVVDDSAPVRKALRVHLQSHGVEVGEAIDGLDAIEKASGLAPDLIVLDLSMPRMDGVDAARELRRLCPNAPIILYTLHADFIRSRVKLPEGVTEVVAKNEDLLVRVLKLLQTV